MPCLIAYDRNEYPGRITDISLGGAGMPDEIKSHIFNPYYTTRSNDGSTGLRLNIVSRIVQGVFGGKISCDTTPGEGTTFLIRFPLITPTVKATSAVSLLPKNVWLEFAGHA